MAFLHNTIICYNKIIYSLIYSPVIVAIYVAAVTVTNLPRMRRPTQTWQQAIWCEPFDDMDAALAFKFLG